MDYMRIYNEAHDAGMRAVEQNPAQSWFPCGFAWVNVSGTSAFGRWLMRKSGLRNVHKGYPRGVDISVWEHGQSYTDKMTHATAMAQYLATKLQDGSITASGRLD